MTGTQRSESANHMLKNYVPPACPMNLFVKHYAKVLFDREQEEGFQEKSTKLAGVVLKVNIPIERHASTVYTRAMFELFGKSLYYSGSYYIKELVPRTEYLATHVKAESREKWYKSRYKVVVSEFRDFFSCECGLFEHMGMICCHALKVMIVLGLNEIPRKHILKRWTVDARDSLPEHLKHYQKDVGLPDCTTFRHNAMYISALELVMMGDSNPEAFDYVMSGLAELKKGALPLSNLKDGMSLIEKRKACNSSSVGKSVPSKCSQKQNIDDGAASSAGKIEWRNAKARTVGGDGKSSVNGNGNIEANSASSTVQGDDLSTVDSNIALTSRTMDTESNMSLLPPKKKPRMRGHPTTARDKSNYEINDKRSRFCTICRGKGHKRTTCPQRGNEAQKPRKIPTCTNCGIAGHRRNTCSKVLYSTLDGVPSVGCI
ncbi:protein FAR-RED IMPAIRED RESPONSE 1-like [Triticum dicoccoides]|uniref:protein FAR-RED IMPAIRED RESPONSE 1-like n=1 Tax=Triticum dicoccoides TaxID=85692 RepID=UPI0018912E44|nr:protein FAR-RED IMPAIRED RESPONSE 1-like [Triticum dicoccoides]